MSKAFTLVELLVVIAIIGILATLVMLNIGSARMKARDSQRKSDINTISKAVEMYYQDHEAYPIPSDLSVANAYLRSSNSSRWDSFGTIINPYLKKLPYDPSQSTSYYYSYIVNLNTADNWTNLSSDGTSYTVNTSRIENINDQKRCAYTAYKVLIANNNGTTTTYKCINTLPAGGGVMGPNAYGVGL